jgi:hypothetical protein
MGEHFTTVWENTTPDLFLQGKPNALTLEIVRQN